MLLNSILQVLGVDDIFFLNNGGKKKGRKVPMVQHQK